MDNRTPLRYTFVLFLLIVPVCLSGQFKGSIEDTIRLNSTPVQEKVFLHTDRLSFMQGDTIWFKAYLWYGYNQEPDTISGVLYVDLINPEGKVILKKKFLIRNGTSHGEFSLGKEIKQGRYALRAYTRWMQNLDTGDPFFQTVTINPASQNFEVAYTPVILKRSGTDSLQVSFRFYEMNPAGDFSNSYNHNVSYSLKIGEKLLQTGNIQVANTKEQVVSCSLEGTGENDTVAIFGISIQDNRLTFEKQFQIPIKEDIDIQFFPEGGKLVTGVKSKVAFKAIGKDGLSREVKGDIEDGEEEVFTSFGSSHKGMGTFLLKPEAKKKYFAHLWYNDRKYIVPLPEATGEGCVMSVSFKGRGGDPSLTIKQSPSEVNSRKYVVGSSYGKIRFAAKVRTSKDSMRLSIPLEEFPEGISRLTVLNENFEPECERLFFVEKNQRFKIEIETDSSTYGKRSKVSLFIKTTGPGGLPVQTDLSLAVADKEQLSGEEKIRGISAYKLLESELQGYIEDVDFYFRNDSVSNFDALDLLMLTHGYRKFEQGNTTPDEQKFQPEKSFDISGNIKLSGSKASETKYNYRQIVLTLVCAPDKQFILLTNPDSLGQFAFQIPLHNGTSNSLIQATSPKWKHFKGDIFIDKVDSIPKIQAPLPSAYNIKPPVVEYVRQMQAVRKAEISKNPAYGVLTHNLPEVTVTAKAKNWYRDFEHEAEKIASLDSLDPKGDRYNSLYELLVEEFGARWHTIRPGDVTIFLPAEGNGPPYYFPIYLVDGQLYFNAGEQPPEIFLAKLRRISYLHVNEIKKLMVLPPRSDISSFYANWVFKMYNFRQSLVEIETYSNNLYRGNPLGIKTFILNGLDAPRDFYSPRYEGPSRNSPIFDGRATLYWNPSVMTDAWGRAKIDFYTSDRQTALEIFINGMEVGTGHTGQRQIVINSALTDLKKQ